MAMIIRAAADADLDSIVRIWGQRLPAPGRAATGRELLLFRARIAPDPVFGIWVAEQDGVVLGWTALNPNRGSPALHDTAADWSIYVDEPHRRTGVATHLAAHVEAFARTTPLEWIVGHIAISNVAMYRFCVIQRGFRVLATIPPSRRNPAREAVLVIAKEV